MNTNVVKIKPILKTNLAFRIVGTSPLIQHKWDEKALMMIRGKHQGRKTKVREVRDPEAEFRAASYKTDDGQFAIPVMAVKKALITAAHKDIGIEKTLVRKGLFLLSGPEKLLPMDCSEPLMREDVVRVGAGSTDLRYRPEFRDWAINVSVEYDAELLTPTDLITLVDRAGFGVGIGEMRPEKDGEYGRFAVDAESTIVKG